ncbi:hypothetical protein LINGRAHAP2_LOCUS23259 [Linum grandiflorum]
MIFYDFLSQISQSLHPSICFEGGVVISAVSGRNSPKTLSLLPSVTIRRSTPAVVRISIFLIS